MWLEQDQSGEKVRNELLGVDIDDHQKHDSSGFLDVQKSITKQQTITPSKMVIIFANMLRDQEAQFKMIRCRVTTSVRGEGRDHGGLGLRSRGEGIGHGIEALLKKKKNEQEIRPNKRKMEAR